MDCRKLGSVKEMLSLGFAMGFRIGMILPGFEFV